MDRSGRVRLGGVRRHCPGVGFWAHVVEAISRTAWGAKRPRWTTRLRRPVDHVFIHHGATVLDDHSRAGETRILQAYQRYHFRKGWADCAYSFAVGVQSGRVYEIRGWNNRPGATKGWNHRSYAICLIGDTTRQEMSETAVDTIRSLIGQGIKAGLIIPNFELKGHRDVANKDCPGVRAYDRLERMRPTNAEATPPKLTAPPLRRTLRVRRPRMRDPLVRFIQVKLGQPVHGVYDQQTAWHVGLFQLQNGLKVDGVYGEQTYKAMFGGR